jgi:hypothetical protein
MPAPNQRQPWPMKWIVVAILLLIVPYTIITLRYRKPGPAFRPYEDIKNRANVTRLLAAGYQRIPITAQRPADGGRAAGGATVTPTSGGIPPELRSTLVEPLLLATDIIQVAASPVTSSDQPYAVQIACALPDEKQQLGGADLYVRGEQLVIAPTFEPIAGGLLARSRQAAVLLTIPAGALKPGNYTVTLLAERTARTWPLEVR